MYGSHSWAVSAPGVVTGGVEREMAAAQAAGGGLVDR
jgi:hypothetical protein